jgi:hypothetical protein
MPSYILVFGILHQVMKTGDGLTASLSCKQVQLCPPLQSQNAENLKQIFPEKEYRGLSPNFQIHVSVSELYISTLALPFLLEKICGPILGIYKSLTDT